MMTSRRKPEYPEKTYTTLGGLELMHMWNTVSAQNHMIAQPIMHIKEIQYLIPS